MALLLIDTRHQHVVTHCVKCGNSKELAHSRLCSRAFSMRPLTLGCSSCSSVTLRTRLAVHKRCLPVILHYQPPPSDTKMPSVVPDRSKSDMGLHRVLVSRLGSALVRRQEAPLSTRSALSRCCVLTKTSAIRNTFHITNFTVPFVQDLLTTLNLLLIVGIRASFGMI